MGALGKLLRHTSSYFVGRLAILLAGLISLPITTRLLTKEEYGLMSLIFLVVTITTALFAFGFPQATTRFFAEHAARGRQSLKRFCITMMLGAVGAGIIAMIVVSLINIGLSKTQSFVEMAVHLQYVVVLILVRIVNSVCLQILRGNQQTLAYNVFSITNRYLTLGVIILLLIYVYQDVAAVFVGTIYVETAFLLIAIVYLYGRGFLGWTRYDSVAVTRAISFGMPLVIADLMVTLVASSDRFVIQYLLGPDSVAIYSVAYDISDYVATMFATPLELAILPIVYSLWSEKGKEATQAFLNNAINLSYVLLIPIIAGFSVVGPDIVTTLASDKYVESGYLIPYIAFGVFLGSANFLLLTGLLLYEKTRLVTMLNGTAAVANLALNVALIPHFGVIGAAYATIVTFVLLSAITYLVSGRFLKVTFDWTLIIKSLTATAGMTLVIWYLDDITGQRTIDALIRTLIGAMIYFGTMTLIEPRVRDVANAVLGKIGVGKNPPDH